MRREAAGVADRRWSASGILSCTASAFADHNPVGTLALGRETGLWSAAFPVTERLWVIGDALIGPATVVEAMAQGRRAAAAFSMPVLLEVRPGRAAERTTARARLLRERGRHTAGAAEASGRILGQGDNVRVLPIARSVSPNWPLRTSW